MGADTHLAVVLLLTSVASFVWTQDARPSCSYMTDIPRPPTPVFPPTDFTGLTWAQRPLIPAPEREDICMDEWVSESETQVIYMEESIDGEVSIAKLNYQGAQTPTIGNFFSGTFATLGPVIRRVDNEWHLIITQRQDYETPEQQIYMFDVRIQGEPSAMVSLVIVNIDDNPPILYVFDPCHADELGSPRETDCEYRLSDADGEISTRFMTFRVDSDRGDDTIFRVHGRNIPGDWFNMRMIVDILQPLDFEAIALHVFQVTAFDSLPNNQTATMMVQVQNIDSRPPRWINIFAVQQFDEKTEQQFLVLAIDGDTGINRAINYTLIRDEEDTFFSLETLAGGRDGAILHVDKIDRDTLMREIFQLTIVAYKDNNASLYTEAHIVIIVNDINDQRPEPLQTDYYISIEEETPLTLNFDEPFGFHDRDLGENAQYTVHLEDDYPPGAASAFQVHPNVGYQEQTFIMSTANHSMLDYEVPEFQEITIKVVAIDRNNSDFTGVATVHISLINWNDELPIFEQTSYSARFNETVGAGFPVATVRARDRDIGDRVVHTLMGNADQYLHIDENTGEIFVSINDAFDYHRQNILFVQVRADDTLGNTVRNTATTQLQIDLEDVNNTPPTLRLPRVNPNVEENVPEQYEIPGELSATDPDTTALLVFEIDWDESWATKAGRDTEEIEYRDCVEIVTVYPDPENTRAAAGRLVVREIRNNVTIDFEMFEVLHLTVRVRDLHTVLNEDYSEATFTIRIIDMNDNWPVFGEGQLEQALLVREESASGVIIGSVVATDIDGPLYNQVRYTIQPREDTPEGLVQIDFYTSQMTVAADGAIDADEPPRHHLYYTVVASDACYAENRSLCPPDPTFWETRGDITIEIIDTNNKVPRAETHLFEERVYIWENATQDETVQQLFSSDLDRDEMYHRRRYQINYLVNSRLRAFFSVDPDSGLVYVDFTTDEVLDRDGDEPTHTIFITISDNFNREGEGRQNQNETVLEVILIDVNDNAPVLPASLSWSISEATEEGYILTPNITATDRDDPETDNARVGFSILNLTLHRDGVTPQDLPDLPDLFLITDLGENTAELSTAFPLRGFWGTYVIQIEAYDHGNPPLDSNEVYELIVRPYNYHRPEFQFPLTGSTIRLSRQTTIDGSLMTPQGVALANVHATDEDGLHAGTVQFHIQGNEEAVEFFGINNGDGNEGTLTMLRTWDDDERIRTFQLTIRATDGGTEPGPLWTDSTVTVIFVPTSIEPAFPTPTQTVTFTEGEDGLSQSSQLELAQDEKNYECQHDVCHNIYYRIVGGNSEGYFALDPSSNVLQLTRELDRSDAATRTIMVGTSNVPDPVLPPEPPAILVVTVNVREASPRPVFEHVLYTAGISTLNSIGWEVLTVRAMHSENATLTYTIDPESMSADSSLEAVRDSAFALHPATGTLTLSMQPTAAMRGMFAFRVNATDPAGATDSTQVQIYLISSQNRVFFTFRNTVEEVDPHMAFIEEVFGTEFRMRCNVDQVLPATDSGGAALADRTEVRAHFIRNNEPVPAEEIEQIRSDTALVGRLQQSLSAHELVLQDFVTGGSGTPASSALAAVYALAALSALLALLCLVLLLTFFLRTRALNRRLQALSMTKYGSVDSGLNRAGLAPGTNKHAVEGSNPIWNEAIKAPDFDAISDTSGDSDLIGIEDLPQFRDDYFPPGDTNSIDEMFNPSVEDVATHNNNFGFASSPFGKQFRA